MNSKFFHTMLFATMMLSSVVSANAVASTAAAQAVETRSPPVESSAGRGIRIAGLLGAGFVLNKPAGVDNVQGLGLGLQASYTVDAGFTIGGTLLWFLGASYETATGTGRFNALQFTVDLGYDILVVPSFVVRPTLGLGINRYYSGGVTISETFRGFVLAPGAEAFYDITEMVYVGALLRVPVAFMGTGSSISHGNTDVALQFAATGGLRF